MIFFLAMICFVCGNGYYAFITVSLCTSIYINVSMLNLGLFKYRYKISGMPNKFLIRIGIPNLNKRSHPLVLFQIEVHSFKYMHLQLNHITVHHYFVIVRVFAL